MSQNKKKSILWELSAYGRNESSYLFGTIHLPERKLMFRLPEAKKLILQCDGFMAEYPLDQQSDFDRDAFRLPMAGLDKYLSTKKYVKIQKQLQKSFDVNISLYQNLKPMILEQILAENMVEEHTGAPMDVLLWDFAKENGKALFGAESLESQMTILRNFPIEAQIKHLIGIAKNPGIYRKQVLKLTDYYLEENLRSLYKTSVKSLANMKAILVYNRNEHIAQEITKQTQTRSIFCAVGAGHLYGKYGLIRLLKKSGFKVRPIQF